MGRDARDLTRGSVAGGGRRVMRKAGDGLPARVFRSWTREKLVYLQKYATAFMMAMAPKKRQGKWDQLVYIDLLAGPGLGIDADTGEEFDGSPLIALHVQPAFDRLFFGDLSPKNVAALRRRIPPGDLSRVSLKQGDCNVLVKEIITQLSSRTLGLAFVDPQGFEVQFTLFQELSKRRIDVLFLFPSGIGIGRNFAVFAKQATSPMDGLWGGMEWRDYPLAKLAAGKRLKPDEERRLDQSWVQGFRDKMAGIGFRYQDKSDPLLRNEKNVPMYHLLFFSHDSAGLKLWQGIKKIEPSGQRTFPL